MRYIIDNTIITPYPDQIGTLDELNPSTEDAIMPLKWSALLPLEPMTRNVAMSIWKHVCKGFPLNTQQQFHKWSLTLEEPPHTLTPP